MAATVSLTPELYAVLSGTLDGPALPRIVTGFANASQNKVHHMHVLFQSTGGGIRDGIRLYEFFKNSSIDLTFYNMDVVSSITVISYLGAKTRKVGRHATFMIRRTQTTEQPTHNDRVAAPVESALVLEKAAEAILREHINMPENRWAHFSHNDLWFSAEQAVKYGIAHEIGDFAVPADAKIATLQVHDLALKCAQQELAEEGHGFEANLIQGVENAKDADISKVATSEVPEDDVPGFAGVMTEAIGF